MVKKKREITEGKKYISNSNNVYAEMVCIEKGNVEWNDFKSLRCIYDHLLLKVGMCVSENSEIDR